ncbi:MAG: serine/threonine protein kinase [Planctomycetota bacterium]|jgi:serine/threonine-protein kinase
MTERTTPCDHELLRLLLVNELPQELETKTIEHVESCPRCRQTLESLAGDQDWWTEVRACFRGQGRSDEAALSVANSGASSAPHRVGQSSYHEDASFAADFAVDFLEPCGRPNTLGRLDDIEILEVIGRGGMGVVLKGYQRELGRYVAVKLMGPHLAASGSARKRFAREARASAAIVHPHVMAIHSVNASSRLPYLVMPFVDCESLQRRLDRHGPLELNEILRIGRQIAAGLAAAHAQGLVHRDVKPANILLEKGVVRVMLTDFGLARAVDDANLTRTGVIAGTPQFMSPEQARGEPVDVRSDLFSLGSVIYAMCTGRPPFRAETSFGVLRRISDSEPRRIGEINTDLPDWLAPIVSRLHAKDPADRVQSAAEVAELLETCLSHVQQPTVVPLPESLKGITTTSPPNRRRKRVAIRISAVAAASLVLMAILVGVFGRPAPDGEESRGPPPAASLKERPGASVLMRPATAQEIRTWTDSTGRHKIEAKLVSSDGSKVVMERADGSRFEIALKLLSKPDQRYVAEARAEDTPFKRVERSPFQPVQPPAGEEEPRSALVEPRSDLLTPDWSGVRMADLTPSKDVWDLEIAEEDPEPTRQARPIGIPSKSNFFEKIRGFVVNAECQRAIIGYALAGRKHGHQQAPSQTRLVLCDLEKGSAAEVVRLEGEFAPLDLYDDGQLLMRRDEWGFGKHDRLELWTLNSSGVSKGVRWNPYDKESGPGRDVKWAKFIDTERVATVGGRGNLVIWDVPSARAIYSLNIQGDCVPALSSDRKWIAFCAEERMGLLDVSAGRVLVIQPAPKMSAPRLAFRPGGRELCALARERLTAWDCTDGQVVSEILLTDVHGSGKPLWTSDHHVLIEGKHLLDLNLQIKIWEYSGGPVEYVDGLCWFVAHPLGSKTSALVPSPIPHAGVEQALEKAAAEPDFFVLQPGVTVKVDVSGLPDAAQRERIRAKLVEKLEAQGITVAEQGTIDLVATAVEKPKKREVRYIHSGTYKVREFITTLRFIYEGQTAWQRSTSNIQHMVMLRRDDNLAAYLKRNEKPSYYFLETVRLPKLLMKPTGEPGLGKSSITVAGVK